MTAPHQSVAAGRTRTLRVGGAGIVGILAAVLAPPLLLALLVGWPLPTGWAAPGDWPGLLTRPLATTVTDRTIVDVLAVLGWLAWAQFLACLTAELAGQLRGGPPLRVPLGSLNQRLARRLVACALVLLPAAAPSTAAFAAPLTRAVPTVVTGSTAAPVALAPPGSPLPAQPAAAPPPAVSPAAAGVPAPASSAPAPAPREYVVRPPHGRHYDSLWDIAARHLGDPLRWREIYALNRGRAQPDGQRLVDADLIQPGWLLLLPADATGADLTAVRTPTPTEEPAASGDPAPVTAPAPTPDSPPGGMRSDEPSPSEVQRSIPAARPVTPPATGETGTATDSGKRSQPTTGGNPTPTQGSHDHDSRVTTPVAPVTAGLSLAALGLLAVLTRRRRIAQRRRRLGRRPAPPPPALAAAEAQLHADARRAEPLAGAVRLATVLAGQHPDAVVRTVAQHPDGQLQLRLDPPAPAPPPFHDTDDTDHADVGWLLPAVDLGYTAAAADSPDPAPALLLVGQHDGIAHYVNVEAAGLIGLAGEDEPTAAVLTGMVATLTGAPWADLVRVLTTPQIAAGLAASDRVETVEDLAGRLPALRSYADSVAADLQECGHGSLPAARRAGADTVGVYVVVGLDADDLDEPTVAAALDPASPLIVIATGTHPRAETWKLTGGRLTIPGLDDPVDPLTVDADLLAASTELVEHTVHAPDVAAEDPHYAAARAGAPPQPDDTPLEVAVLGPVQLHGGPPLEGRKALEVLVYLALHRRGVDADQLSTALWPDKALSSQRLRNRLGQARALVGGAISAGPRWRLDATVGCDWQRFQALAAGGRDDRHAALRLVRGQPFDGLGNPEWLSADGLLADVEAAVVDLAAAVADADLNAGDPAGAYAAARAGLRANRYDERLYRLAMRAAQAEGATGKVDALLRELHRALDGDVEPDDEMETATQRLHRKIKDEAARAAAGRR